MIKTKALKDWLCYMLPKAFEHLHYETHVAQWPQSLYRKD